jgi:hypothetical protein
MRDLDLIIMLFDHHQLFLLAAPPTSLPKLTSPRNRATTPIQFLLKPQNLPTQNFLPKKTLQIGIISCPVRLNSTLPFPLLVLTRQNISILFRPLKTCPPSTFHRRFPRNPSNPPPKIYVLLAPNIASVTLGHIFFDNFPFARFILRALTAARGGPCGGRSDFY